MSNTQVHALRNMPIWIERCNRRANSIVRIEGHTNDSEQLIALRDYMRLVVCQYAL